MAATNRVLTLTGSTAKVVEVTMRPLRAGGYNFRAVVEVTDSGGAKHFFNGSLNGYNVNGPALDNFMGVVLRAVAFDSELETVRPPGVTVPTGIQE